MSGIVDGIIALASKGPESNPGDYEHDGLLVCGVCNRPKQCRVEVLGTQYTPPVPCLCEQAAAHESEAQQRREEFQRRIADMRRDGITDPAYLRHTFAGDDRRDTVTSDICRRYVDAWEEMKADGTGILFYGGVGVGKTFYAAAIANALIDRCVTAAVTNLPKLLNLMFAGDKQAVVDRLQRYQLLVIDDFGVERGTEYAAEQVYSVIDARSRSGLPLIVTTNLTLDELKNPPDVQRQRIYDRVLEMCPIPIRMTGLSRRTENADVRKRRAREILGGGA